VSANDPKQPVPIKKGETLAMKEIEVDGDTYECNVDSVHMPSVERMLRGTTDSDTAIQAMEIPIRPIWLRLAVKSLRWYRNRVSPMLGNRCVFEPSCSHYSELAFRQRGAIRGALATVSRLYRCRLENGGIDMP
jgi:putative membrane protein insertion efficiency factor